jgi:hypothetical protein
LGSFYTRECKPKIETMKRRHLFLAALAAVGAIAAGLFLVFLLSDSDEQRRQMEVILLGRTVEEVTATLEAKVNFHITREDFQKKHPHAPEWPAGDDAVGHWIVGPPGREALVQAWFDRDGRAIKVSVRDLLSFEDRFRRFFRFF